MLGNPALAIAAGLWVVAAWPGPSCAQGGLSLESIRVVDDSVMAGRAEIALTFSSPPTVYPIYAMTEPPRIVVDLANTRISEGVAPSKVKSRVVTEITVVKKTIEDVPNTRIEVILKESLYYKAFVSGNRIMISVLSSTGEEQAVPLFRADKTAISRCTLTSLDMRAMEKAVEIETGFTMPPQSASVYMMDSPPRIIMDLNDVSAEKDFEKKVDTPPVKSIRVMRRPGEPPYTGVVIMVEKNAVFRYRFAGSKILLDISSSSKAAKGRMLMLIGAGVALAGGTVTGILLGTEGEEKPGTQGASGDLGAPPGLPDF